MLRDRDFFLKSPCPVEANTIIRLLICTDTSIQINRLSLITPALTKDIFPIQSIIINRFYGGEAEV
jgi:hypothetical protein